MDSVSYAVGNIFFLVYICLHFVQRVTFKYMEVVFVLVVVVVKYTLWGVPFLL